MRCVPPSPAQLELLFSRFPGPGGEIGRSVTWVLRLVFSRLSLVATACLSHVLAMHALPWLAPLTEGAVLPPRSCRECQDLFSPAELTATSTAHSPSPSCRI